MSKLSNLALIAAIFMVQLPAGATPLQADHEQEESKLYAFIPGDPHFRVNPKGIPKTEAVLTRSDAGLSLVLKSRQLPPGAYTVWMRVFNEPALCTGGEGVEGSVCSRGSDWMGGMSRPAVPDATGKSTSSGFWLTGALVGEDGIIHVSTSVAKNQWPGMVVIGTDAFGTSYQGVWNPLGAEVHIVLRYHGPAAAPVGPTFMMDPVTGMMTGMSKQEMDAYLLLGRQLNEFMGNCSMMMSENPANCQDVQLAVFAPPSSR